MKTKNIFIAFILLICINFSCSEFLQEDPKSILAPSTYPSSEAEVLQIFGGVSTTINGLTKTRWHLLETSTDILSTQSLPGEASGDLDHYTFQPDNGNFLSMWQGNYKIINTMNLMIDRLESLDESWVTPYVGAAKALRAFAYFELVQTFGDLPILTIPSSEVDLFEIKREPVSKVYEQIVMDLTSAETNLQGKTWTNVLLPSYGFTKSLLAKVYMTMAGNPVNDISKWSLAALKAKEVVDLKIYQLVKPYSDLWLIAKENSKEHIYSSQPAYNGAASTLNANIRPQNIGVQRGNGESTIFIEFYNEFSSNDTRRNVSILTEILSTTGSTGGNPKIYYYTSWGTTPKERFPAVGKYFDSGRAYEDWQKYSRNVGNNFPLLRYSDVLLTLAESENEANGPTELAYSAINQIRERAGISLLSGLTQNEFRDSVRFERKKELCFECQRRFDLLRWGTFLTVMVLDPYAGPNVKSHHVLFPIPYVERLVNPNLEQNPGY